MSSPAQELVRGCGKTRQILTLYHVGPDGTARPLTHGFEHLACGYYPEALETVTYGILLCSNCADLLGFAPSPVAETESAKPSRP